MATHAGPPRAGRDRGDRAARFLGRPLPAVVQISGGFRARVSSTTRLQ
jgi:hypothetical protein